jgi:hypothetical protein
MTPTSAAYWPLSEMRLPCPLYPVIARLEREAGFVRSDTAADRLAKLETGPAGCAAVDPGG